MATQIPLYEIRKGTEENFETMCLIPDGENVDEILGLFEEGNSEENYFVWNSVMRVSVELTLEDHN